MIKFDPIWPDYSTGAAEHMRALGVASANYNLYENSLYELLYHHYQRAGLTHNEVSQLFHEIQNKGRLESLQFIFKSREKDRKVAKAVSHAIKHFNVCAQKRHFLIHSRLEPHPLGEIFANLLWPEKQKLHLIKKPKNDWTKLNSMQLSLKHLRAIADEFHEGYSFAQSLVFYLKLRDRPVGPLGENGLLTGVLPASRPPPLPEKPPIPRNLKLRQHPPGHANDKPQP